MIEKIKRLLNKEITNLNILNKNIPNYTAEELLIEYQCLQELNTGFKRVRSLIEKFLK